MLKVVLHYDWSENNEYQRELKRKKDFILSEFLTKAENRSALKVDINTEQMKKLVKIPTAIKAFEIALLNEDFIRDYHAELLDALSGT